MDDDCDDFDDFDDLDLELPKLKSGILPKGQYFLI